MHLSLLNSVGTMVIQWWNVSFPQWKKVTSEFSCVHPCTCIKFQLQVNLLYLWFPAPFSSNQAFVSMVSQKRAWFTYCCCWHCFCLTIYFNTHTDGRLLGLSFTSYCFPYPRAPVWSGGLIAKRTEISEWKLHVILLLFSGRDGFYCCPFNQRRLVL